MNELRYEDWTSLARVHPELVPGHEFVGELDGLCLYCGVNATRAIHSRETARSIRRPFLCIDGSVVPGV